MVKKICINMLYIIALISLGISTTLRADTLPTKSIVYLYGEPQMIYLPTGQISSHKVLFQRITDPALGYILEDACSQNPGAQATHNPAYIILGKDDTVTLSDTLEQNPKPVFQGTGKVYGDSWNWNYLKFSIIYFSTHQNSKNVRIEDSNFILPDQTLIARKQFFYEGETSPFMLYDATYNVISKDEYIRLFQQMGCFSSLIV